MSDVAPLDLNGGSRSACLVCEALLARVAPVSRACTYCDVPCEASVLCPSGHHVCDACRSRDGFEVIRLHCERTTSLAPLRMAQLLMTHPAVGSNAATHAFLVAAVLVTAKANSCGEPDEKRRQLAVAERRVRSTGMTCGDHGICGAALGTAIFMSISSRVGPVSTVESRLSVNVEQAPSSRRRVPSSCCRRDMFVTVLTTAQFISRTLKVPLDTTAETPICDLGHLKQPCHQESCRYCRVS